MLFQTDPAALDIKPEDLLKSAQKSGHDKLDDPVSRLGLPPITALLGSFTVSPDPEESVRCRDGASDSRYVNYRPLPVTRECSPPH